MINLKNITDETTDSSRFSALKTKQNFFPCAAQDGVGSHGLGRRVRGHGHSDLGDLDRALDAALGRPVRAGRAVGVLVRAVRLAHAVVEGLRGAFARREHAPEGVPQVLAPQSVDDGVHGGIEQAEHTAEGKHRLNELVHLPKDVIDHDGEQRAPADDQHHQDEDQRLGQPDVHAGLVRPRHLHLAVLRRVDDDALLGAALNHAHRVAVGLPEDVHVGVHDEQEQHAGHPDPEHQVGFVDEGEDVRANRLQFLAVPAQERQHSDHNCYGPHQAKRHHSLGPGDNSLIGQGPVNRYIPVDGGEEQAAHRGSEGGRDAAQFEQKHVGAVFAVEHVEINEAIDKDDTPQKVCHRQAADEVVGRPAAEAARVQDDTQHQQVLQNCEGAQSEGQHSDGQLLAGVQNHEALHVHEVLPTLNVVIFLVG